MADTPARLPEEVAVEEQGNVVRELKTKKAPKEEIDAAVAELKKRKAALAAVRPAEQDDKGGKAGAAAAAAAATKVEDLSAHFASALAISNCPPGLTPQERFALVRSVGEECIEEAELAKLLETNPHPVCYDGFEPSGRMHIAQGVQKAVNVNKLTRAGCTFVFWVADWFAQLNNKMGGDLEKIRTVGRYFIEVWRACGMEMERVKFLWASDEINARSGEYWMMVMDVARRNSVKRITRCCTIMGRKEDDDLSAAQILYPCMQCSDIFFLKADICQLGLDQRKVNMLAREYCDQTKRPKPIILSHHMSPGLKEGQEKMSKSDPNSAIFMEDSAEEVASKIKKAFCPEKKVEGNPCLEYVQYMVLPQLGRLEVKRDAESGGDKTYTAIADIHADFASGALHPVALKAGLTAALNEILEPVRRHFAEDAEARRLMELVREYRVTK